MPQPRGSHQPSPISGVRGPQQRLASPFLTDPLHHPDQASDRVRVRRAWSLAFLALLLPGSVQLMLGNKTLGRRALKVTLGLWVLLLGLVLLGFLNRALLLTLLTNSWVLLAATGLLLALALGGVYLLADAWRLLRPSLLPGRARAGVSLFLVLAMLVTGGGLSYGAYVTWLGRGALGSIFGSGSLQAQDGRYNILLMGGDAGSDRVGRRPDSMTVASIDAKTGQAITISLPRNLQNAIFAQGSPLWSVYPEGFNCGDECILNALYPTVIQEQADLYPGVEDPGAQAMMEAASGILGIRVQNYLLVDMAGFEQLIDALGGITIEVGGAVPIGGGTNAYTGEPNPIEGYIEPGIQHLDGFHALWYARSREGASDYDRQARQRCVQAAMLKQLDPANVLTKFADITAAGEQVVETNIPSSGLAKLADLGLKSKNYELIQFAAGPPYFDPMFPTYPDFDQLQRAVQQVISDSAQGVAPTISAAPGLALIETVTFKAQPVSELSPNGTCSVP